MHPELQKIDDTVAALTARGQPFELNNVEVGGISYRNYAAMPASLGEFLAKLPEHGDRDFVVYRSERYSFARFYQHSAELAAALQQRYGIAPGDRVAILSRNNPQWLMAFVATVSIGAVAVPMNSWWVSEELDYGFSDSGARVVVADRARVALLQPIADRHGLRIIAIEDCGDLAVATTSFAELLRDFEGSAMPAVPVSADDHATIMYTSGSTGHPKGALSSHRGILSTIYSWFLLGLASKMAGPEPEAGNPWPAAALLTVPLFHCTASHSVFLMSVLIGRKLVIMHKWDAQDALRLIEEERITWFNGVPTMSAELQAAAATSDRDISSLADVMAGGAARPPAQVGKIADTFRKSTPGIGYGLTETNALGAVNTGAFYIANPHSTGRVVPAVTDFRITGPDGREVAPGENGELCIKSPANVLGYWNKPEATAEAFVDGWFHTGDVGYMDAEGFVYIVDRIKEVIIRGGENISCLEVEAAIYSHPQVHEVAVFGLPDERLGEAVGAAVVLREGEQLSAGDLQNYLAEHLAAFKIPAHLWFRSEQLPRIASGKIFKRQLKADYAARLANEA